MGKKKGEKGIKRQKYRKEIEGKTGRDRKVTEKKKKAIKQKKNKEERERKK